MTKQATEITATAIYKITIKETGKECYAVPSDSHQGMYYRTCWNAELNNWECTCRHGQEQAKVALAAHCKHTRAAQVAIKANKPFETSTKGALNRKPEVKLEQAPSGKLVPMR